MNATIDRALDELLGKAVVTLGGAFIVLAVAAVKRLAADLERANVPIDDAVAVAREIVRQIDANPANAVLTGVEKMGRARAALAHRLAERGDVHGRTADTLLQLAVAELGQPAPDVPAQ